MKKSILLLIAAFGAVTASKAQCVPESDFEGTGLTFTPSTLDPVYACASCGDHTRVISIQTFADTTLNVELAPGNPPLAVTVFADFFRLDSIGGLPDGLTYTTDAAFDTTYDAVTNPFGYWINPGDTASGFTNTNGCITIEGDAAAWTAAIGGGPNNDGVYPLTLFIDARAANFSPAAIGGIVGFNTWLTDMGELLDAFGDPNFTENGILLQGPSLEVVQSGVGIRESQNEKALSFYPNPTSDVVTLALDAETSSLGTVVVHNSLGEMVFQEALAITVGKNVRSFDCSGFASGLYNFTVEFDGHILCKKVLVK